MQDFLVHTREAMWDVVCAVLGIDKDSEEAASLIFYTDNDDTTAVEYPRDKDIIFISADTRQDSGATSWFSTTIEDGKVIQERTIPLQCMFTVYGPNSAMNADRLWAGIPIDIGPGCPRDVMRVAGIVPVLPLQRPTSVPDQQGGLWRFRYDLQIQMNLLWRNEYSFNAVEKVPEIKIET